MEQRFKDKKAPYKVLELDQEYTDLKSRVTKYERRILKELGFCVHARHPHKFMITMLQSLGLIRNWRLCQAAWSYMNDALKTHVFVRHLPEVVSCACVQMACDLVHERRFKNSCVRAPPAGSGFLRVRSDGLRSG